MLTRARKKAHMANALVLCVLWEMTMLHGLPKPSTQASVRDVQWAFEEGGRAMMDMPSSNRLPVLAASITAEHGECLAAMRKSLQHALAAGDMLIEAKGLVAHGQWLPWLADNCGIPKRTAQLYMRLAKHRELIEAKSADVALLTIQGAVELMDRKPTFSGSEKLDDIEPEAVPVDVYLAEREPLCDGEVRLALDAIRFRRDLYPRREVSHDVIRHYSRLLSILPPIEINQHHEIIDGFMRWEAHRLAGAETIRATITVVASEIEHLTIAVARNASHGYALRKDA
ncbi:DUF3102 domain-containing protein [Sinorhizobium meliloti]|nr:DUF3102 domain-containing protein [Sinorhizobium meliloti]